MALTLSVDQVEIEEAIKKHVKTLITITGNVDVTLRAGRGENGISADIVINASNQVAEIPEEPVKRTTTRKKTTAKEETVEPETEAVEEEVAQEPEAVEEPASVEAEQKGKSLFKV